MSVFLVGAGPGAADLITVRGANVLARADVVVHDRLVEPALLDLARRDAQLIDVGKSPGAGVAQSTINELLVELGQRFECVVRLKGGDPFVFGRGGEEVMALRSAGVTCEVIPGVTSALSAPLAAGIPVTHRGVARGVTVVTGHVADERDDYFRRVAHPDLTLVVLMGVHRRAWIAGELMSSGLDASTPVAVIERASTPRQCLTRSTLANLGALTVASPAVIVIGPAAALDLCDVTELADVTA